MTARLDGKVALISGVSDGIGGCVARCFAREGASVVCSGIQMDAVEAIVADIRTRGGQALALELDVTVVDHWDAAVQRTIASFGGFDVLVNNAGLLLLASIEETSLDDFRQVHDVNVGGVFLGLQAAVVAMAPGGVAGNGGSIINISSVAASTAAMNHVAYGSSKAAVSGMTRHAASECAATKKGIRVNAICPGVVRTAMFVNTPENIENVSANHPLGPGETADIAAAALYLASDESRWVTGTELTVDGGYSVRL